MKMKDIDHTNPHTNEPFTAAFSRGAEIAADGGRETGDERMKDVTHESPNDGPKRTFERGTEGRHRIADREEPVRVHLLGHLDVCGAAVDLLAICSASANRGSRSIHSLR